MLNEAPKKEKKKKDYANPTPWQLFRRIQWESFRRAISPFLMYLFMSMLALACQAIDLPAARIVLGILCIAGGAFFNGHLLYHTGRLHYGAYVAGVLHRRNAAFGIASGEGHHKEREFRPWKGFLIGFYVGLPVIVFGILAGAISMSETWGYVSMFFMMLAGWAIIPITWFGTGPEGVGLAVSAYWSILFVFLPIIVSGIFYLYGAYKERKEREAMSARDQAVEEAGKNAKKGKK